MAFLIGERRISAKISRILGLLFITFILLVGVTLQHYHDSMMADRKEKAQKLVENASNLVNYYYEKAQKGDLSEEQAQHYALESIKHISPHNESYYWVINTKAYIIMHPVKPDLENRDMTDYVGPDGQKLFLEMVRIATSNGDGYIEYMWTRPEKNNDRLYPKISYMKLFAPWGWIIGSGVYVDDVDESFWNAVYVASGISVAVLMFIMALGITVSESLKKHT